MRKKAAGRAIFTKEMKKTHTILIPSMLPMHFELIKSVFISAGYKAEMLEDSGREVADSGLKYVHNDACYPAILIIGQFISAVESGRYDPHKVALIISQTGGGCRASNYISLLRKALERAGYGYIPVISLSFAGLESNPGFRPTPRMLYGMLYAVLFGDLLMCLLNQCRPYEVRKGESRALADRWTRELGSDIMTGRTGYGAVREKYPLIVRSFAEIPLNRSVKKAKVGIVGEIFVKFSPLGNNNLEDFLISEGAETVMPGLFDFLLYCVYNGILDAKLYGLRKLKALGSKFLYKYLIKKQNDYREAIISEGSFIPPCSFERTLKLPRGYIGMGVKMGEGWLLTAEMLELIQSGVKNVICAQPFGCLPNHIVGKGVMKRIKETNPGANIIAVDYDPGASRINQENRIKLMLANSGRAEIAEAAACRESVMKAGV